MTKEKIVKKLQIVQQRKNLLDSFVKVMNENEEFLHKNIPDAPDEIVELINDGIDAASFTAKRDEKDDRQDKYVNWAMGSFSQNFLSPFSNGMYIDLLTGNLPVCFAQLRIMLESLAKSYYADSRYPSHLVFIQKLDLLEIDLKKGKITITDLMKEVDKLLGTEFLERKERITSLWSDISKNWLHSKGVSDKMIKSLIKGQGVPSWAVTLPMNYTKNDLQDIQKLNTQVSEFRKILELAIANWKNYLRRK